MWGSLHADRNVGQDGTCKVQSLSKLAAACRRGYFVGLETIPLRIDYHLCISSALMRRGAGTIERPRGVIPHSAICTVSGHGEEYVEALRRHAGERRT